MHLSWHASRMACACHVASPIIVMQWNNSEGHRRILSLRHAVQQHNMGRRGQHLVTSPLLLLLMTRFWRFCTAPSAPCAKLLAEP